MTRNAAAPDYTLLTLSKEWSKGGRRLGHASTARCVVEDCYSIVFVALRTGAGNRPVCFRHFEVLDSVSLPPL